MGAVFFQTKKFADLGLASDGVAVAEVDQRAALQAMKSASEPPKKE